MPHSEIRGSKVVRTSPRLIAAYHVLHRLSAPRHPPNALLALDRSHYRKPLGGNLDRGDPGFLRLSIERPFASNISESRAVKRSPRWSLAPLKPCGSIKRSDMFPLHDDRQHALRSVRLPRKLFFKDGSRQSGFGSRRKQLCCSPSSVLWWSQTGSNRRPHACKARALPTELWPLQIRENRGQTTEKFSVVCHPSSVIRNWWAWEDLNFRPHAYQARALTN